MARKTPRVVRHPAALRDLIEIADYIAGTKSLAAADRFTAAAEKTIERLAGMPGIGSRWGGDQPQLADVRFFPVSRYPNHLVFYRPLEDGIEVVRVLHGARDIESILNAEDDEDG
jgi:toxin ParE1/3/4